jgi:hypothetical protein
MHTKMPRHKKIRMLQHSNLFHVIRAHFIKNHALYNIFKHFGIDIDNNVPLVWHYHIRHNFIQYSVLKHRRIHVIHQDQCYFGRNHYQQFLHEFKLFTLTIRISRAPHQKLFNIGLNLTHQFC